MKNNMRNILTELESTNKMRYEVGGRGGYCKVPAAAVLTALNIPEKYTDMCPEYIGAGCNYLGGGLRGSIFCTAGFQEHGIPKTYAARLNRFAQLLKTRYEELENGLNDETDQDGETNWEAMGTRLSRQAGVVSAY